MNTPVPSWTCPGCKAVLSTRYCPACGEHELHAQELTLRGLLRQAFEAFTSFDARLPRTVRTLVARPGLLTNFYLHGSRRSYIGPFALFLLANVLFVAIEALTGSNVFSTPLVKHLHNQPWSELAQPLVSRRLESLQTSLEAYSPAFDRAVAAHAKSLIILMVLPFSLLPPLVFYRKPLPFAAHLAFSLHFFTFMLLLISTALAALGINALLGGPGLASQTLDDAVSISLVASCAAYLFFAMRPVYNANGWARVFKSLILVVAATAIFLGYRFALFLLTLYTTP